MPVPFIPCLLGWCLPPNLATMQAESKVEGDLCVKLVHDSLSRGTHLNSLIITFIIIAPRLAGRTNEQPSRFEQIRPFVMQAIASDVVSVRYDRERGGRKGVRLTLTRRHYGISQLELIRGNALVLMYKKMSGCFRVLAFILAAINSNIVEGFGIRSTIKNVSLGSKLPSATNMSAKGETLDRRSLITSVIASSIILSRPSASLANDVATGSQSVLSPPKRFTSSQIAALLSPVPTFTIVDKTGTPYMVVGEDAKLTAYFFTSYGEADRILKLASDSATNALKELQKEINEKRKLSGQKPLTKEEVKDEVGINPWKSARISSVPLDFAVTLANRGKMKGAYFRIAPSEADIDDALGVDQSDDLPEGKVPLFYFEDFKFVSDTPLWSGGNEQIPLFFQKGQLIDEWMKRNPKTDIPEIKVTELFSLLTNLVQAEEADDDLEKLVLIPPKESKAKAKLCFDKGGTESPFKLGERLVIL